MWSKIQKEEKPVDLPELVLTSPEGIPWAEFPGTVVAPIRRLISRIKRKGEIPQRLSFVSALRGEGVSFISWAFATTLANDFETTVCIVDLNWWWPSDFFFKINASSGLSGLLKGESSIDCAIAKTGKPNLSVLPSGELQIQERAQFSRSTILKETILELSTRYEHLVLDIPAVLATDDALPLASMGTGYCLVILQGATSIDEAKSAVRDLDHISSLGVVMNRYSFATPKVLLNIINPY